MGVKMHHMSERKLRVVYEEVTGVEIDTEDGLPKMFCWECVARLSSAYNIIKKALKTHLMLVNKMKSTKFISMADIESIDKAELKSTLGPKFYGENFSSLHIINESDDNISQHIKTEDEQNFETDIVVERIKLENEMEAQHAYDFTMDGSIEGGETEHVSDEMLIDNESNASEDFEEDNDVIKQGQKRKCRNEKPAESNKTSEGPRCKKLRVVGEDTMPSPTKHNTQDSLNYQTDEAQSTEDNNENVFYRSINKETLLQDDENTVKVSKNTTACENLSISDPVSVQTGSVTKNKCDKSQRGRKLTNRTCKKNNSKNIFTCKYCSFETSVKSRLKYHGTSKHPKSSYNCAHCNFVSNIRSNLVRHLNNIHIKNTVYNCSYCDYSTSHKYNLKSHINKFHTKDNVYNCSFCNFKTYDKCAHSAHENAMHTKLKVFTCPYCNYKAYKNSNLNIHVNIVHTKVNVFKCSYCSYKTYKKGSFTTHVNSKHTKILSYNCSLCSYKAYEKGLLKAHVNAKHTKVKVFTCSHCNLQVYYKSVLARHIKMKHSDEASMATQ